MKKNIVLATALSVAFLVSTATFAQDAPKKKETEVEKIKEHHEKEKEKREEKKEEKEKKKEEKKEEKK